MITLEQHESLKLIAKGAVYRHRKQFNPDFPLSKIMTCKECSEAGAAHPLLVGYDHNNGKAGDKRKYYKRYRCRACNRNILRDELHTKLSDSLLDLQLAQDRISDFIGALRHVWQEEQSLSYNTAESLQTRLKTLDNDKKTVILKQVRGELADERADLALDEQINDIKEQLDSISTVEKDFVEFVEFAMNTVEGFRQKFWELDQEHQRWCKQLLFPDGFSVTREKKVYTPKISDFYRLNKNAPKDVSADFSDMVTSWRIELQLPG